MGVEPSGSWPKSSFPHQLCNKMSFLAELAVTSAPGDINSWRAFIPSDFGLARFT